jgi:Chitinase class I
MAGGKTKTKPAGPKRPFLKHGGQTIQIPLLQGPVGPETPALRSKYPTLNTPIDVETIQFYLSELIDIRYLSVAGSPAWTQQCLVNPPKGLDDSAVAALKQFQTKQRVVNAEETSTPLVKPDGPTLIALADYADYVAKLDGVKYGVGVKSPADYIVYGTFDMEKFVRLYKASFSKNPHYSEAMEPNLRQLLTFMAGDPYMVDLRWMAYILATTAWEATAPVTETHKNAKGKTITSHPWRMTWSPVEESGHGKGRSYERAVKVAQLADGTVRVTEWDGDQWTVKSDGSHTALSKGPHLGVSTSLAAPVKAYTDDSGTENTYFGRGYVQLTWWTNYATAGINIGQGTSLLLNPDLALDPAIAYQLMSYCLRTGYGFANGHKLGDYIYGAIANYSGARAMVNGTDHAGDIAKYAKQFESILMESRN